MKAMVMIHLLRLVGFVYRWVTVFGLKMYLFPPKLCKTFGHSVVPTIVRSRDRCPDQRRLPPVQIAAVTRLNSQNLHCSLTIIITKLDNTTTLWKCHSCCVFPHELAVTLHIYSARHSLASFEAELSPHPRGWSSKIIGATTHLGFSSTAFLGIILACSVS